MSDKRSHTTNDGWQPSPENGSGVSRGYQPSAPPSQPIHHGYQPVSQQSNPSSNEPPGED